MTKREETTIDPELIHALRTDAAGSPGAAVQARVFARIENHLAALAVPVSAAAATATAAPQSAASAPSAAPVPDVASPAAHSLLASVLSKPIGIALMSAAVGGAGTYAVSEYTQPTERPGDHVASTTVPPTARAIATVPSATQSQSQSQPLPNQTPEVTRPTPASRNEVARRPSRASALPPNPNPTSVPRATLPSGSVSLGEQQALLDAARKALARGESGAVLEALNAHSSRYPNSDLVEEREALAIKALVAAGQYAAARERGARFQQRFPSSLLAPSVTAALRTIP